MHVVAVASRKGGSGKTTLAGHLAVAAERAGLKPALVIDTDPQGNLADWWNARQAETPLFARASAARLAAGVQRIRALGVGVLIIDTPPALTATVADIVGFADFVLIPVRPSPHDLRAVGAMVELVERRAKPFAFAVNGVTPRTRIASEAVMALSQLGPVAPVLIHHRTGFAASMIDGRTVMEIPDEARSAQEIAALWTYVALRLVRGPHGVVRVPQPACRPEAATWAA